MLWTSLKAVMGVLFMMMGKKVPYEIKSFSFTDSSSYVCANGIGSVSLPILSLLTSGMTWYEKHFSAYPANEGTRQIYENGKLLFVEVHDVKSKQTPSSTWIPFDELGAPGDHRKAYDESTSYRQFFSDLRKKVGDDLFCREAQQPWAKTLLNKLFMGNDVFGNGINWKIDSLTVLNKDLHIDSITKDDGMRPPWVVRGGGGNEEFHDDRWMQLGGGLHDP